MRKLILVVVLLLLPAISSGQVTVALSPVAKQQFFSATGVPLATGCVNTYVSGTSTPLATYTDGTGTTPNTNPIILDAGGFAAIFLANASYRFVVVAYDGIPGNKCAAGVTQYTIDSINAFQAIASANNLFLAGNTSDPAGTAGEMTYRTDIPCFRFFTTFWDCVVRLTDTQTLTNKTLTAPTITGPTTTGTDAGVETLSNKTLTSPVINGAATGTALNGLGTKLATSAVLGASVPVCTDGNGTLATIGCLSPVSNVANFVAKAQTAALGSTAFFTCNVLGAPSTCHIVGYFYIVTQTSGTGTTASATLRWLDGETSVSENVTSATINLGAAGAIQQGVVFMQLANGGTVNYSTTVGSIGTSKYSVYFY